MNRLATRFPWAIFCSALAGVLPAQGILDAAQAFGAPVAAVDSVAIVVSDADRSAAFFSNVLTFEKVSEVELVGEGIERIHGIFGARVKIVRMRLGEELVELTEFMAPRGRAMPADSQSNDRWFQHVAIIVSDMDRAYRILREHKVEHASPEPQRLPSWNKNAAGIRAFYFKDPDGHALEILEFPPGKGPEKWHKKTNHLFLGIDHTAIVVSDTEQSLKFYRDHLGLKVVGESENYGTEQEHLNNVFGARLRIRTLRADGGGPAVEFLEYITPSDGRAAPSDLRANDLASWQTVLTTNDVEAAFTELRSSHGAFVSPGPVDVGGTAERTGSRRSLLVRDPDGHAVRLVQIQR